jgi:hypothetical protein
VYLIRPFFHCMEGTDIVIRCRWPSLPRARSNSPDIHTRTDHPASCPTFRFPISYSRVSFFRCLPLLTLPHSYFLLWRSRNLRHSLELANVVADSRYKLYEDFVNEDNGRRLGDYLGAVRQAILGGLEKGGSDPFRVMVLGL